MVGSRMVDRSMIGGSRMVDRSMVSRSRCMVLRCRGMITWCLSVVSFSFIGDISHISTIVISMVGHMLSSAIREQHRVGTLRKEYEEHVEYTN